MNDQKYSIELLNLKKRYGDFEAVHDLTLHVKKGSIFAFLGNNGAGKTTTIKMMTGQLRPTGGKVHILGQDIWEDRKARKQVGYVPDTPLLHEGLTAREMLWFVGGLYGIPLETARQRADQLLGQMGLSERADDLIRDFSLGMKRKMAIAAALIHKPEVLLLDEVTNGLDPRASREVKELIKEVAREGCTVFLTTHILDIVEELADTIAILHKGQLKIQGTLEELRSVVEMPNATLEQIFLSLTGEEGQGGSQACQTS
ncbi:MULTISPECIES: ABC transporter ATP-binding protein [Bacillales]|jgi:ABC-2 type transport system ATP-binding protein|uniref:ABC transporter ATP-binding protein n=1 Tax=Brevibacillus aydinogluensis TaxID=927786 RepID=A0AA48M891_9BACL|nr:MULTISPECIES: ABC transporter ATP-binding protein [Bacillales]NNV03592.1 ABC transporter ATP-binding protein [Brevibacillus sp. MCWH]REK61431.1 MAG: ABC transporter ATP-binding protein [Brevibacillus sp.]UFJ60245.1 ABC transporter ATP-binding protein [Anoxybacillus sediminis]CAJ1003102.1 ABC transporter ATP-binding protein [Brevibacillus aydinogluensis]